jgi:hypothetical protein
MKILIIQTSPFHTASTFLVNAVYGIIPELLEKRIICIYKKAHFLYMCFLKNEYIHAQPKFQSSLF